MATDSNLRSVYGVSELAETLRMLVEDAMPRVWVEGEISNFSRPASGHWYFTLKDAKAQIRCAMFRGANHLVRPQPANGDRVLVRAEVSFYTGRGDLQLICQHMEAAGEGALLRAFEALKKRLAAEGLFAAAIKRPVPLMPRHIGIITSATGAALQDVSAALQRRFPLCPVSLWPVPVQGDAAAPAIVKALQRLPERRDVDVILLVRGGGSLEDLWAFNEEVVARAIRACAVPVVSGIGHEIDTSIADLAADVRATTPTAAAELTSPDGNVLKQQLRKQEQDMRAALEALLERSVERLDRCAVRLKLQHPQRALRDRAQKLDEIGVRMGTLSRRAMDERWLKLQNLHKRLRAQHPKARIDQLQRQLQMSVRHLAQLQLSQISMHKTRLDKHQAVLNSLSPQAVLQRGYALARLTDGSFLRTPEALPVDAEFELLLAGGSLKARRSSS